MKKSIIIVICLIFGIVFVMGATNTDITENKIESVEGEYEWLNVTADINASGNLEVGGTNWVAGDFFVTGVGSNIEMQPVAGNMFLNGAAIYLYEDLLGRVFGDMWGYFHFTGQKTNAGLWSDLIVRERGVYINFGPDVDAQNQIFFPANKNETQLGTDEYIWWNLFLGGNLSCSHDCNISIQELVNIRDSTIPELSYNITQASGFFENDTDRIQFNGSVGVNGFTNFSKNFTDNDFVSTVDRAFNFVTVVEPSVILNSLNRGVFISYLYEAVAMGSNNYALEIEATNSSAAIYSNSTNDLTQDSYGVYIIHDSSVSTNNAWGSFFKGVSNKIGYGFQGYGETRSSLSSGAGIGVFGYSVAPEDGLAVSEAFRAYPFPSGNLSKEWAYYGSRGNNLYKGGITYFTITNDTSSFSTFWGGQFIPNGNITHGQDSGSMVIENLLEVGNDSNLHGLTYLNLPYVEASNWSEGVTLNFAGTGRGYDYNMTFTENITSNGREGWSFDSYSTNANEYYDQLICNDAGLYSLDYSAVGDGQNNAIYVAGISINGEIQNKTMTRKKMSAGGDIVTMSGTGVLDLEQGDTVSLFVYTDQAGAGTYYGMNLNLVRIGGIDEEWIE